jgi:Flp pilus assembly protein TadG
MKSPAKKSRFRQVRARRGAAAVECAIIAPLLALLVLGAIDVGQFANVYQKVSDASREGARLAARSSTITTAQVEAAVMDYLKQTTPNVAPGTLVAATTVTVMSGDGTSMSGDITSIPSGSQVRVQVTMQFDPVRLISGIGELDGSQITTTTMMRRD